MADDPAADADTPDPDAPDPDAPDARDTHDDHGDEVFERPVDKFRRTAAGSVVAAGLLGLRDVMEGRPEKEETSIVSEAPTRPVGDLDVVIDLDHPERNIAIVRRRPSADAPPDATGDETPPPSP